MPELQSHLVYGATVLPNYGKEEGYPVTKEWRTLWETNKSIVGMPIVMHHNTTEKQTAAFGSSPKYGNAGRVLAQDVDPKDGKLRIWFGLYDDVAGHHVKRFIDNGDMRAVSIGYSMLWDDLNQKMVECSFKEVSVVTIGKHKGCWITDVLDFETVCACFSKTFTPVHDLSEKSRKQIQTHIAEVQHDLQQRPNIFNWISVENSSNFLHMADQSQNPNLVAESAVSAPSVPSASGQQQPRAVPELNAPPPTESKDGEPTEGTQAAQQQLTAEQLLVDDEGRPLDRSKMTEEHQVLYDLIAKGVINPNKSKEFVDAMIASRRIHADALRDLRTENKALEEQAVALKKEKQESIEVSSKLLDDAIKDIVNLLSPSDKEAVKAFFEQRSQDYHAATSTSEKDAAQAAFERSFLPIAVKCRAELYHRGMASAEFAHNAIVQKQAVRSLFGTINASRQDLQTFHSGTDAMDTETDTPQVLGRRTAVEASMTGTPESSTPAPSKRARPNDPNEDPAQTYIMKLFEQQPIGAGRNRRVDGAEFDRPKAEAAFHAWHKRVS